MTVHCAIITRYNYCIIVHVGESWLIYRARWLVFTLLPTPAVDSPQACQSGLIHGTRMLLSLTVKVFKTVVANAPNVVD